MYFSRTFKALNFDFQIQGLSRTFKVRANPDNRWHWKFSLYMHLVATPNGLMIECTGRL